MRHLARNSRKIDGTCRVWPEMINLLILWKVDVLLGVGEFPTTLTPPVIAIHFLHDRITTDP